MAIFHSELLVYQRVHGIARRVFMSFLYMIYEMHMDNMVQICFLVLYIYIYIWMYEYKHRNIGY